MSGAARDFVEGTAPGPAPVILACSNSPVACCLTNKATKASELAGQEIDRLGDPTATDEERQLRKRRLLKGPKEFRDIRSNVKTTR